MKKQSYQRINRAIYGKPWAITDNAFWTVHEVYQRHISGLNAESLKAFSGELDDSGDDGDDYDIVGETAIVSLNGVILKHASSLERMCGASDVDAFVDVFEQAYTDPRVKNVILNFNSPGGTVTGVPEAADYIKSLIDDDENEDNVKQVVAFTDSTMCSAAYWLASACDTIVCTPSSDVGSIGVFTLIYDSSVKMAQEGVKPVLINAGSLKGQGSNGVPISAEMEDHLRNDVLDTYSQFTSFVTMNRKIDESDMQGQAFSGTKAVSKNMADYNVNSLNDLIYLLNS